MQKLANLLLLAFLILTSTVSYGQKTKTKAAIVDNSLYPLKIQNDLIKSENVDHIYFIFMAKSMDSLAKVGGLQFTYDPVSNTQIATLVELDSLSAASDFMFQLDTMQGYNAVTNEINLQIPHVQSGRAMMSINYPLTININDTLGVYTFVPPNVNNTTDPSYNIIFDKFEFTFNNTITTNAPHGTFYINPTAVDFFALPISLESSSKNSGAPKGASRPGMLDTIQNTLQNYDKTSTKIWDTLVVKDPSTGTVLRVASPTLAPGFDTSYLHSPTLGYDYISSLISYYQNDTVLIDCSQLDVKTDQIFDYYGIKPTEDSLAYIFTGTINQNEEFVFWNNPDTLSAIRDTIFMADVKSNDFFGPGQAPFDTPNKMVKSILVESLTSAFSVGLLPVENNTLLSKAYFHSRSNDYYTTNSFIPTAQKNTGPWYDLYAQAIHSTKAVIYAFAFDDVLAQDGTISSSDLSDTISIRLGEIGNVQIPNPEDSYLVQAVQVDSIVPFNCVDSLCTVKAYWNIPDKQSPNAKYFLGLSGGQFSIAIDSVIKLQSNYLVPYDQDSTSLTIHQKYLGVNPSAISVIAYTCGKDTCGCPTPTNFSNWDCAMGTNPYPKPSTPLLAVTDIKLTPFAPIPGGKCEIKLDWTVPVNQSTDAQYYIMLLGNGKNGTFSISADSIIALQLGNFAQFDDTTASLSVDTSQLGTDYQLIGAMIFTCGAPQCSCPTQNDFSHTTCSVGAAGVLPKKSKKAKGKKKKKAKK